MQSGPYKAWFSQTQLKLNGSFEVKRDNGDSLRSNDNGESVIVTLVLGLDEQDPDIYDDDYDDYEYRGEVMTYVRRLSNGINTV